MDTNQIAKQAVSKSFENKDILEDAFHGNEFSTLDIDMWRELIDEVLFEQKQPRIPDSEQLILSECQRLYKATRLQIKTRVKQLENKIKSELNVKE